MLTMPATMTIIRTIRVTNRNAGDAVDDDDDDDDGNDNADDDSL